MWEIWEVVELGLLECYRSVDCLEEGENKGSDE